MFLLHVDSNRGRYQITSPRQHRVERLSAAQENFSCCRRGSKYGRHNSTNPALLFCNISIINLKTSQ